MSGEMGREWEGKTGRENDESKGAYRYFFFPTSSPTQYNILLLLLLLTLLNNATVTLVHGNKKASTKTLSDGTRSVNVNINAPRLLYKNSLLTIHSFP